MKGFIMQNYGLKEFRRILIDNGYERKRQKGSHEIWRNEQKKDTVSITNKITGVNACIGRKMIKEHNLIVR